MEAEQLNAFINQLDDLESRNRIAEVSLTSMANETRLNELTRLTEDPAIWDDKKRAQEIGREKNRWRALSITLENGRDSW